MRLDALILCGTLCVFSALERTQLAHGFETKAKVGPRTQHARNGGRRAMYDREPESLTKDRTCMREWKQPERENVEEREESKREREREVKSMYHLGRKTAKEKKGHRSGEHESTATDIHHGQDRKERE